jgi:hypothetical protein
MLALVVLVVAAVEHGAALVALQISFLLRVLVILGVRVTAPVGCKRLAVVVVVLALLAGTALAVLAGPAARVGPLRFLGLLKLLRAEAVAVPTLALAAGVAGVAVAAMGAKAPVPVPLGKTERQTLGAGPVVREMGEVAEPAVPELLSLG